MKAWYSLVVVSLGLLLAPPGWCQGTAASLQGSALLRDCRAFLAALERPPRPPEGDAASSYCLGRIEGLTDMHRLAVERAGMPPLFCVPTGVAMGETIGVVVRYLETHPDALPVAGGVATLQALQDAYPCPP
jgi:hypothetical protein